MKKYVNQSVTITTGLAIFAMLFGAGNLIFPLKLGIMCGNQTWLGLIAFIISGVLLPIAGLIGMVFFDGDYELFFGRIGRIPGKLFTLFCMLILGPLLVMPRIVSLTYTLLSPFIASYISLLGYSILFSILTFIFCFKQNKIVSILGQILSPIKLTTLSVIICIGLLTANTSPIIEKAALTLFAENFLMGYNLLDLIGSIFFAYIIISILKKTLDPITANNHSALATIIIRGGLIGGALLALVYVGMGYLGAFHGQGLELLNPATAFREIMIRIIGYKGALFIGITVLVACLSTMIALSSVVTEYLRANVLKNSRYSHYHLLLALVLATTVVIAQYGIENILKFSEPFIMMAYPALIMLTFCNISYKLWKFKPVKTPVFLALFIGIYVYTPDLINLIKQESSLVIMTPVEKELL